MNEEATSLHIIGEAGTNHGGDLKTAQRLVGIAESAGCDSVKFQLLWPEGLYVPQLLDGDDEAHQRVLAERRRTAWEEQEFRELAKYCGSREIALSASVFDERGLDLLDEIDAPYIKIASTDLNNYPLLRLAAERGRRIVLSTGMSDLREIERAVRTITAEAVPPPVLMHCVSIYPAPVGVSNVRFVKVLRREFGFEVGFSDHTRTATAAVLAAGFGATWFEKHFTYDRAAEGFDHAYALDEAEFDTYVRSLREADSALQAPVSKLTPDELAVRARARRGLYAARDLKPGTTIRADDVLIVRPPSKLTPGDLELVFGSTVQQPLKRYEALEERHFGVP